MSFEAVVFRPLPRPLKHFPQETEASFLDRLATANAMPVQRLQRPSHWLDSRLGSGRPAQRPQRTAPNLDPVRDPPLGATGMDIPQGPLVATPRWACRRCVARRTGNPGQGVMVWM